jgi:hypothetical protein
LNHETQSVDGKFVAVPLAQILYFDHGVRLSDGRADVPSRWGLARQRQPGIGCRVAVELNGLVVVAAVAPGIGTASRAASDA